MNQTPPFVKGLPLFGNMLAFLQDKIKVIDTGYQQHGEVFAINLAGQNVAILLGPEHSQTFFALTDKALSIKEPTQFLVPVVGEIGSLGTHEGYLQERKIVAPILGGRNMKGHVAAMVRETKDWIAEQPSAGSFDLNEFSQEITMNVAARALLGDAFREGFGEEFVHLFHDLANGVDQFLPDSLPLPKFRKRDKAKKALDRLLLDLIHERRQNADQYDDFLQKMIEAELDDGTHFSDQRVVSLILLMIFAGFDTTSGHLAWAIAFLLERPDYLKLVQEEVGAVFEKSDTIELKHLKEMPHLNYAIMEVERFRPAVEVLARLVKEPIDIGGYHIPEGWMVMISPEYSHRLERVFSDPHQYDPERFNDERCEHAQHKNTLTGFGGGMHRCWGMNFANYEMAVIIALLLKTYDMEITPMPFKQKKIAGIWRPDVHVEFKTKKAMPA
ncbi:MAG: cytochrome P450 [Chloroflexota bacterium]